MGRQYRIVNPEATDSEIEKLVESGETQVFSQAVSSLFSLITGQSLDSISSSSPAAEVEKQTRSMQP